MPSIEEQKRLGMRTEDERWRTGDTVAIKGTKEWGKIIHCEGNRVEVLLDYSLTRSSYVMRKKRSHELEKKELENGTEAPEKG